jgi:aconitate hydratase
MSIDIYNARSILATGSGEFSIFRLDALEKAGITQLDRLPYSIRVLLESILRQVNGRTITETHVQALSDWKPTSNNRPEIPFQPARVVMQDFTGVPAVVDLAAMRSSLARLGGEPELITPQIPVDLVIDQIP